MKGRHLPGAVERPFGAPARFTSDEFAEVVLGQRPADEAQASPTPRSPGHVPLLVRLALEAAER